MGEAFTKGSGIPWDTWNPSGWGVPNGRAAVPALWELRVRRETQRTLIHLQGKSRSRCTHSAVRMCWGPGPTQMACSVGWQRQVHEGLSRKMKAVVLSWEQFCLSWDPGHVWRCLLATSWAPLEEGAAVISCLKTRDAGKYPAVHQAPLHDKELLSPDANGTEAERLFVEEGSHCPHHGEQERMSALPSHLLLAEPQENPVGLAVWRN